MPAQFLNYIPTALQRILYGEYLIGNFRFEVVFSSRAEVGIDQRAWCPQVKS
jgi:hypothetical protein